MGFVESAVEIEKILSWQDSKAIIICTNYNKIKRYFKEYHTVALGKELADRLIRYPQEQRKEIIFKELDSLLLNSRDEKILVKDIEVLFNPEYKIDVLKYFVGLARVKKVAVVWSGIVVEDYLQYAEIQYEDYQRYLIKNYDIVCVK